MDYKEVGLKAGIEIHQQLDTHKLFCKCPSTLRQDEPDVNVKRRLYAVAGEAGTIDIAAAYEQSKKKEYVYQAYSDTTCLVELDEEPPHPINQEALKIALQISLLLNAKPVQVTQAMRKTVVDGSNTSGFQRTLLIATDGWLDINGKKIGIQSICLEEDAARIIKQTDKESIFRLDRLGIPLVEIATAPDISSPEEAKLVALKLGEILRACKVKRGIGTIRQDVNMSIQGKARFEIKGVQEPWLIAKTIETEVDRQLKLLKQGKKLEQEVRRAEVDGTTTFLRPLPGAARMYPETDIPLITITSAMVSEIKSSLPKIVSHEEISEEHGLSKDLSRDLIKNKKLEIFESFKKKFANVKSAFIAEQLIKYDIDNEVMEKIFTKLNNNEITKDSVNEIINNYQKTKKLDFSKFEVKAIDIDSEVKKLIKEKPSLSANAYMGLIMSRHKGKVNAAQVMEIIKKYI